MFYFPSLPPSELQKNITQYLWQTDNNGLFVLNRSWTDNNKRGASGTWSFQGGATVLLLKADS